MLRLIYKLDSVRMPNRAEAFDQQKLSGGIISVHWEWYITFEEPGIPLPGQDSLMELGMEDNYEHRILP